MNNLKETLGNCSVNAASQKPPSTVDREINILGQSADTQNQLIEELSRRLEPVLTRNQLSEASKEPEEEAVCEIAQSVRVTRNRIELHNRILQNLLERLEI